MADKTLNVAILHSTRFELMASVENSLYKGEGRSSRRWRWCLRTLFRASMLAFLRCTPTFSGAHPLKPTTGASTLTSHVCGHSRSLGILQLHLITPAQTHPAH